VQAGVIGILTGKGPACDELQEWLEHELAGLSHIVRVVRKTGNQIAWQRNEIVRDLDPNEGFVLYIDNDNVPPAGALSILYDASSISGIASGAIIERVLPFDLCAVKSLEPYLRYKVSDISGLRDPFPVVACGTGCLMVRRDVFKDMGEPWFQCGQIHPELLSEDLDFCLRAVQVGHPTYLVPSVKVGHRTDLILWPGDDGQHWAQWPESSSRAVYRTPLFLGSEREIHE
jgi:hypothetical protein